MFQVSRKYVLSIYTSKQVVEHVSPPKELKQV